MSWAISLTIMAIAVAVALAALIHEILTRRR